MSIVSSLRRYRQENQSALDTHLREREREREREEKISVSLNIRVIVLMMSIQSYLLLHASVESL